jgi:N-methylhydantoinase A
MGGTSCDVCTIVAGEVAETAARTIAGRPLALPALDIHTVGAGGGSIAWRDAGGALRVGPRSAGAQPGPACYGRGGREATVTDAHVLLGRLPPETSLAGVTLDREAAHSAVAALAGELELELQACAEGIVRVAEEQMAGALRRMTVERGVDPRDWVLMPFGGAGGLHAAALAEMLGMRRVLFPRAAGVLSALGLAAAAPRRDAARTVLLSGGELTAARVTAERAQLIERAGAAVRIVVRYEMRYRGQSFELSVDEDLSDAATVDVAALREAFEHAHEERYGYCDAGEEVELVTMRASAWGQAPAVNLASGELAPGTSVVGPTIYALPEATLWVPPGWAGTVDAQGSVRLQRA